MNYSFRKIEELDIEKICNLPQNEEELFFMFPKAVFPLTKDQLFERVQERADSYIFLNEDKTIGFANLYDIKENEYGFIGNLIVSPAYRKQGVAKFILSTMEQILKTNYGAKEIRLSCFNNNTSGLILYHKLGFKPYCTEERVSFKGETIIAFLEKKIIS